MSLLIRIKIIFYYFLCDVHYIVRKGMQTANATFKLIIVDMKYIFLDSYSRLESAFTLD